MELCGNHLKPLHLGGNIRHHHNLKPLHLGGIPQYGLGMMMLMMMLGMLDVSYMYHRARHDDADDMPCSSIIAIGIRFKVRNSVLRDRTR